MQLLDTGIFFREVLEESLKQVVAKAVAKVIDERIAVFLAKTGEKSKEDVEAQIAEIFDGVSEVRGQDFLSPSRKVSMMYGTSELLGVPVSSFTEEIGQKLYCHVKQHAVSTKVLPSLPNEGSI
eukprot:6981752-Lingulodinium_polyedra.AAC.1